jgi:hypothetical protein
VIGEYFITKTAHRDHLVPSGKFLLILKEKQLLCESLHVIAELSCGMEDTAYLPFAVTFHTQRSSHVPTGNNANASSLATSINYQMSIHRTPLHNQRT